MVARPATAGTRRGDPRGRPPHNPFALSLSKTRKEPTHDRNGSAGTQPQLAVARIKQAEDAGVPAVWMTIGGAGGADPMATFAAAGAQTGSVLMGTAIVPNMPRHPIIMAQQAIAVAQLAPGRFRLGIGPSHQTTMENTFGFSFNKPLTRLGEYLDIVSALLTEGQVDVDGEFYTAHTRTPTALDVPLMASALRSASYEFCGARGIPALSWVCPAAYLRDSALPAMQRGAERAGHETPPLIAHVPVCLSDDRDAVRDAVRRSSPTTPERPSTSACSPTPASRRPPRAPGATP